MYPHLWEYILILPTNPSKVWCRTFRCRAESILRQVVKRSVSRKWSSKDYGRVCKSVISSCTAVQRVCHFFEWWACVFGNRKLTSIFKVISHHSLDPAFFNSCSKVDVTTQAIPSRIWGDGLIMYVFKFWYIVESFSICSRRVPSKLYPKGHKSTVKWILHHVPNPLINWRKKRSLFYSLETEQITRRRREEARRLPQSFPRSVDGGPKVQLRCPSSQPPRK